MKKNKRIILSIVFIVLLLFILICTYWCFSIYFPYKNYIKSCNKLSKVEITKSKERHLFKDEKGYSFFIKSPTFLSWSGNLGIDTPNLFSTTGKEIPYSNSLIIWPKGNKIDELGVILFSCSENENGINCSSNQLYIDEKGNYIPYGDEKTDINNKKLLENNKKEITILLEKMHKIWFD